MSRAAKSWFLDRIEVDSAGLIRLVGWWFDGLEDPISAERLVSVFLDGQQVPFLQCFQLPRPASDEHQKVMSGKTSVALEFMVVENSFASATTLTIKFSEGEILPFDINLAFLQPHYRQLMDTSIVLHRQHVYGSGPPNPSANPEILELVSHLKGPLLDFGCGRGALVDELRRRGIEAFGLELDHETIRPYLSVSNQEFLSFYDGSFPSPFKPGQFRSVVCTEVLEHIPDYKAAIEDIARVVQEKVIFTVPDCSAIPMGFRHGIVPWHLLEGTHLNFFTQRSLEAALRPHFKRVEFGRVGHSHVNEMDYYVSLSAFCTK